MKSVVTSPSIKSNLDYTGNGNSLIKLDLSATQFKEHFFVPEDSLTQLKAAMSYSNSLYVYTYFIKWSWFWIWFWCCTIYKKSVPVTRKQLVNSCQQRTEATKKGFFVWVNNSRLLLKKKICYFPTIFSNTLHPQYMQHIQLNAGTHFHSCL